MERVKVFPTGKALIPIVLEHLQAEGADWHRNLVIFPGRRPAHFLRKALAERFGGPYIGPSIWSIEDWVDHLARDVLAFGGRWLEPLDACAVLFEVHRSLTHRYGGDHFLGASRFLPLGLRLLDTLELLHAGAVAPEQLAEVGLNEPLVDYYRAFYDQLERQNYWTRARRFRKVAERLAEVDLSHYNRIILAGWCALLAVEVRLARQLLNLPQAVGLFLAGPGLEAMLQRLGVACSSAEKTPASLPAVHIYQAPDRHGQVFALAEKLAKQREITQRPLDERTVVVLPAADLLFAVLHHAVSVLPKGEPYNVSLGYPLGRTPVMAFVRALVALAEGCTGKDCYDAQAYVRFIHHPYTKNIRFGQRTDVTRILMHALEAHVIQNGKSSVALDQLEAETLLFEAAAQQAAILDAAATPEALQAHLRALHDRTLRRLPQKAATLADWAQRTIEVLTYIATYSTARLHPYFDRFFEQLIEALEAIERSLLGNAELERPSDYLRLLESLGAMQRVPFEGTPVAGLQVLGFLESRGLNFETVYVLDANEDVLPAAEDPDPFLPDALRRRLGLPTVEDWQRLVQYYMENLIYGARDVHLFYMENPRRGERSRFVEQLIWQLEQQQGSARAAEPVQLVSYKLRLHAKHPAPIPKTEAMLNVLRTLPYSASLLDTYLTCPLRFYYRAVLNLREPETIADEPDARTTGELVHQALQCFFAPLVGRPLRADALKVERLHRVIEACFDQRYGQPLAPALALLRRQITRRLEAYLAWQSEQLATQEITILALEQSLEVSWKGFTLKGFVDRIDQRGDQIFLLDYKTGGYRTVSASQLNPDDRSSWAKTIGSFQLPLYRLLYAQARNQLPEVIATRYVRLGQGDFAEVDSGVEDTEAYKRVLVVLEQLLQEIADPKIPLRPAEALEKACPSCPYRSFCGTQWVQ